MPGYSKLSLKNIEGEEKFKCVHCKFFLRNPHQSICGHRFCYSCVETLDSRNTMTVCPLCSVEDPSSELESIILSLLTINPDYAIKREMRKLSAKCTNSGCDWTGDFEKYTKHEPKCHYAEVSCSNEGCLEILKRCDLENHLINYCIMRSVVCEHCRSRILFKDTKDHEEVQCTRVPVTCRFCSREIPKNELNEHTDPSTGNCERKRHWCNFHTIGCDETIANDKQNEHDKEATEKHMHFLLESVSDCKLSFEEHERHTKRAVEISRFVSQQEKTVEEMRARLSELKVDFEKSKAMKAQYLESEDSDEFRTFIERIESRLRELKSKIEILEVKLSTCDGVTGVLNRDVERNADAVQSVRMDDKWVRERLEALERKLKAQDKIIALKDVSLAEQDLRIQSLERVGYEGMLNWKITEFARKRRDAISGHTLSQYSPYFFTSRFGYKMCARVYLNGDGMGKGNHVSLFFVIMKGEYDAILRWPFRQKVTFMWIDQNNKEHMIDAFRPDPNSSSFRRPTSDLNIASGCPLFMPLNLLDSDAHAYIKDDVAFVRIIVDSSDL